MYACDSRFKFTHALHSVPVDVKLIAKLNLFDVTDLYNIVAQIHARVANQLKSNALQLQKRLKSNKNISILKKKS